ncbi:CoA transferase [[Mycobacterium] crassicus]|uniref:CoA transferase n=1 Tax=[Mycobacterium] crassicus TaxID=2872309 RepID=A0ABU5XKV7_9MYCO|nr:CoA transferase [Mycolicibacter sp. MYC098]MEB3022831.1 CoA transferase [Mycolicibacter sp. MYC098]
MAQLEPLRGIRLVSLAINLPGPLAAARLRALGAAVTKIEPPTGDPVRAVAPTWYEELVAGQRVLTLDLKNGDDRATADKELAGADLLITAMRPSALAGLGLDDLAAVHPRLSHVEIVGHDGAAAEQPGHDLTYQAAFGTLQPPTMPTVPVADTLGAERAVSAALIALRIAAISGKGHHERVVLEHAAADAGAAVRHGLMGQGAPLGGAHPGYGIYASADGHVAFAALEPHFWSRACAGLGVEGSREELEQVFLTRSTSEWERLALRLDIPLTGIRNPLQGVTR